MVFLNQSWVCKLILLRWDLCSPTHNSSHLTDHKNLRVYCPLRSWWPTGFFMRLIMELFLSNPSFKTTFCILELYRKLPFRRPLSNVFLCTPLSLFPLLYISTWWLRAKNSFLECRLQSLCGGTTDTTVFRWRVLGSHTHTTHHSSMCCWFSNPLYFIFEFFWRQSSHILSWDQHTFAAIISDRK